MYPSNIANAVWIVITGTVKRAARKFRRCPEGSVAFVTDTRSVAPLVVITVRGVAWMMPIMQRVAPK